jgi:hypothetical protein
LIGPVPQPDLEPSPTIGEEPADLMPEPDLGPAPVPQPQPQPETDEEKKEEEPDCSNPKWLSQVTWSTGPQGQAQKVTAEPLTKCPGNTVASAADERVYQAQFDCIRTAGKRRTFHPLHVLHGLTRFSGPENLHGPGNEAWNIIIGSTALNGLAYHRAEWPAIERVHRFGQGLWYEATVDRYIPGNEFFADSITIAFGAFDLDKRTRGPRIGGGTFPESKTAPVCPPSSSLPVAGVPPITTLPPPADFVSTLKICAGGLESRRFTIADGGVSVSIRADWVPPGGSGTCPAAGYAITLWRDNSYWPDGNFGTQPLPVGRAVSVSWEHLTPGTYYLQIKPDLPWYESLRGCCLDGDVAVRTYYAPVPTVPEFA